MQEKTLTKDGLPEDKGYLECGLPSYLEESLQKMKEAWGKKERGEEYNYFDADYCTLQSDINCAEVNQEISTEAAWYLREKYLDISRETIL
ncbi:MAG TPA: hypothetical protein IAB44_04750 [Candidatus Limivivens intestinipullorum]|uniref:Uncharacterized protein n=1 Tax=Candidatus Limivivens intestinipullorum TaxID=2840858 RepID=A0A9D1ERS8_9FIRM|nr:hypothetical protein [Candidatus Limivivens intestinipullorum]